MLHKRGGIEVVDYITQRGRDRSDNTDRSHYTKGDKVIDQIIGVYKGESCTFFFLCFFCCVIIGRSSTREVVLEK